MYLSNLPKVQLKVNYTFMSIHVCTVYEGSTGLTDY